jgi:hypothetical protein
MRLSPTSSLRSMASRRFNMEPEARVFALTDAEAGATYEDRGRLQ